ncbi:MAG: hypothetical protein Q7S48_04935 [bacterium]|nr:hypothetical protein [bacterium]
MPLSSTSIAMGNNLNMTPDIIEAIKFIVSVIAPVIIGWLGLQYGLRQLKEQKRLDYIEKQLSEFYSPLLGLHKEIRAKSNLRVKVQKIGDEVWKDNVQAGLQPSIEPIEREIEYNKHQSQEEFIPMYRQMLEIFRKNYWLAEPETREQYIALVEYVEGWNRSLAHSVSGETMRRIGHTEANLKPFYEELEKRTEILRMVLSQKN